MDQLNAPRLGDRVTTILGEGTIVGFEVFTRAGNGLTVSRFTSHHSRIQVALDDQCGWIYNMHQRHPFMIASDFVPRLMEPREPAPVTPAAPRPPKVEDTPPPTAPLVEPRGFWKWVKTIFKGE